MKEVKNICLLNDSFPPLIDGVANAILNYARIIENNYGHAIVSTPYYPGAEDDYPFEVIRYKSLDTTKLVGYRAGMPLNVNELSMYVDKDIDILHCHCPIASMYLARVLRNELEKPIILTYHTKFDIDIKRSVDGKLLQDVAINTLVSNISAADEVWCVSRGAGENLKSLGYKGDYIVMPNGVDFEKGKAPEKEIENLRQQHSLSPDVPTYLFVGRMMWYKGIRIILDALRILKNNGQKFRMLFVGDGLELDQITDYCHELELDDEVAFVGAVRDRDLLKTYFSACNLFLFPSTFDTNGIVVTEAASAALASILIKDSCAAEEATDEVNAFMIEENAESLAKKLIEIGDNFALMEKIGKNAQRDLYTSWEESVARAWERYQIVADKFTYKKPTLLDKDSSLLDNLFNVYATMAGDLEEARKINEEVTTKVNDMLDRWL